MLSLYKLWYELN